jgi:hypothetical protein
MLLARARTADSVQNGGLCPDVIAIDVDPARAAEQRLRPEERAVLRVGLDPVVVAVPRTSLSVGR